MWVSKNLSFQRSKFDKVVFQTVKAFPGMVLSGGWVRDKLLGLATDDFDIVAPYAKFGTLKTSFARLLNENARNSHLQVSKLQTRMRKGLPFTPCHLTFMGKFKEPQGAQRGGQGKWRSFKIDIKQLHGHRSLEDDYEFRDFSANCLFYDVQKDSFQGIKEDFKDIQNKVLFPVFSLTKRIDLIRLLRAVRLSKSKKLVLSEKLHQAMLEGKNVLNFQGLGARLTNHTNERSPREYLKMLRDQTNRVTQFAELYRYGYIFGWPYYLPSSEVGLFVKTLKAHFNSQLERLIKWKEWHNIIPTKQGESYSGGLLAVGLLMAIAIVSTVKLVDFSKSSLQLVLQVFEAFLLRQAKFQIGDEVFHFLRLDKQENGSLTRSLQQFSNTIYSQHIRAVSVESLLPPESEQATAYSSGSEAADRIEYWEPKNNEQEVSQADVLD